MRPLYLPAVDAAAGLLRSGSTWPFGRPVEDEGLGGMIGAADLPLLESRKRILLIFVGLLRLKELVDGDCPWIFGLTSPRSR